MSAARRIPTAPKHLSPASKALWRDVLGAYEMESHHLVLLRLALEALDRAEQARQAVAENGVLVEGRYGLRPHPAESIERQNRASAQSLLRELGLDLEAPTKPHSPSRWRS